MCRLDLIPDKNEISLRCKSLEYGGIPSLLCLDKLRFYLRLNFRIRSSHQYLPFFFFSLYHPAADVSNHSAAERFLLSGAISGPPLIDFSGYSLYNYYDQDSFSVSINDNKAVGSVSHSKAYPTK